MDVHFFSVPPVPLSYSHTATTALQEYVRAHVLSTPGPCHRAALEGFLSSGADLDLPSLDERGNPEYPLAMACMEGSSGWVGLLLEMGADPCVKPAEEDMAAEDFDPEVPFSPISNVLRFLGDELADNGDSLEDISQGPVESMRLLLAAGANPFSADPFEGMTPNNQSSCYTSWFCMVRERLSDTKVSPAQQQAVLSVTSLFLEKLEPSLKHAFVDAILDEALGDHSVEAEMMLKWPPALLKAWSDSALATRIDKMLPDSCPVLPKQRF